ncbi:hypothetical protein HORM4_790045 [Vibrio harveyi]|uniref:hypothetical protein n=1 Tax=Vibrio harveyi TaxID=669 RepID=UPI002AD60CE8|nr:hypothetical protein [Vibrio harveyi]CAK6716173.1 hypothetical protein HORM4_790045 [Vibrio harveyi]
MSLIHVLNKKQLPPSAPSHNDLAYLKRNTPIAIIDDEDFADLDGIRNAGYSPTHFRDLDSFDQLVSFPIVICDIQGVGGKFGSSTDGSYIIQQVCEQFPDKYTIVVSSKSASLGTAARIEKADAKLTRGDRDALNNVILNAVKTMGDSVERWKRFRRHLIEEKQIDLYHVWELEQEFIKSLNSKSTKSFSAYVNKHTEDFVKGLLISFIAGLVF